MGKNTLTALLEDLRALILKSRPAYRDFTVEESEVSAIASGIFDEENLTLLDEDFTGFVLGEKYRVTINGAEQIVTAVDMELS
nr:MAG TPA: hypothetical protein [Caudoviricetes sp.]